MRVPTEEEIAAARAEIAREDRENRARALRKSAAAEENARRARLPSEHPEHVHGMMCDGQDGMNSHCERIRRKLFKGEDK